MTIKQKFNILVWAFVVLLVFNISLLATIFLHQIKEHNAQNQNDTTMYQNLPPQMPPQRGFFKQLIINDLQLSDEQIAEFEVYKHDFIVQSHIYFDSIQIYNQTINTELNKQNPDMQLINMYATKIGNIHKTLKMNFVNYYLNIKSILTPEQQAKLPEVFEKFRQHPPMNSPGQQHRHRWRGGRP